MGLSMEPWEAVWAALFDHIGQEHAISGDELARKCMISGTRSLRHAVHEARVEHGKLILSAPGLGYYRPRDGREVQEFYERLRSHGIEELLIAAAVARAARRDHPGFEADPWIEEFASRTGQHVQGTLF